MSNACSLQSKHVQQKLVPTKFNFLSRKQNVIQDEMIGDLKMVLSQIATMYSRETKIYGSVLDLNVIKITTTAL